MLLSDCPPLSPPAALPRRRDFVRLTASKNAVHGQGHVLQIAPNFANRSAAPRVGYTISKKVHKHAVVRNRLRRLLREAVRQLLKPYLKTGYDYVFVARRSLIDMSFEQIHTALLQTMRRVRV